jgi:hypothetical protein
MMVLRRPHASRPKGICEVRLLHSAKDTSAQFDDPNLVSCAGLVPVMRLAQDCDLAGLIVEHLKMSVAVGANQHLKIPGIVAGMIAGADSIDDLDVLRHGGMGELFGGIRAPSTLGSMLGSFLRGFDWGNVRQLEVVSQLPDGHASLTRTSSSWKSPTCSSTATGGLCGSWTLSADTPVRADCLPARSRAGTASPLPTAGTPHTPNPPSPRACAAWSYA